jgi:hypothetical protein
VERKTVVLPEVILEWLRHEDPEVILEWLRHEAGQEWVEDKVKGWGKRRKGRPTKYPEDDLDVIKIAYAVVRGGLKLRKAIIAVIGGKVEWNRKRYDRLLDRCAEKGTEGERAGKGEELCTDLRGLAEQIAPAEHLPADIRERKPIFDGDELLKQKP